MPALGHTASTSYAGNDLAGLIAAALPNSEDLCPAKVSAAVCRDDDSAGRLLLFVGGHFRDYERLGDAAINVLNDFTPLVEQISIDEAFADVAGCTHLFGPPAEIASTIRRRVRTELGLPISVGVARTKHLAKIASQVAKPDGLVIVDPATELDFLHNLPVELMWGVGPVTKARLAEIGVLSIGQLAKISERSLTRLLGPAASEKLDRAGLELRSATNQDASASAIGRSTVSTRQEAC